MHAYTALKENAEKSASWFPLSRETKTQIKTVLAVAANFLLFIMTGLSIDKEIAAQRQSTIPQGDQNSTQLEQFGILTNASTIYQTPGICFFFGMIFLSGLAWGHQLKEDGI